MNGLQGWVMRRCNQPSAIADQPKSKAANTPSCQGAVQPSRGNSSAKTTSGSCKTAWRWVKLRRCSLPRLVAPAKDANAPPAAE